MEERNQDKLRLKSLKEFVLKRLPPNSVFRRVILAEPDEIPPEHFKVKIDSWLNILKMEGV
jgi:hypothetical protein